MSSENKKYKVYTKSGDKGSTSLIGGNRVMKSDMKVDAYGTIDELKSYIGLIHSSVSESQKKDFLNQIMIKLFVAESIVASNNELTAAKMPQLIENDIFKLEKGIDEMDKELEALNAFILPSGHPIVAHCHIARTICRRAERVCIHILEENPYISIVTQYLNRLSDYLFIYARWICKDLRIEEVKWDGR